MDKKEQKHETNKAVAFNDEVSETKNFNLLSFVKRYYLFLLLIVLCIVVGIVQPSFWSLGNMSNVLFQTAYIGISACGMTILIASGLIDLSLAGIIAVSSIMVAKILPTSTVEMAILVALVLGALFGLINGLLVGMVKIAPFIATLGTQYLFLGTAFIMTQGKVVPITSHNYRSLTTSKIAGIIPIALVVFILLLALTFFIVKHTYIGRNARAIGSNEVSAGLAGISVPWTKIIVFVFSGICAALAGVFLAGRLSSTEGNMAMGIEMTVIAAVVVGGTSMRGGKASISGTLVGSIFFAVLSSALNILGVSSYLQYVVTGVVLIAAIAFGNRKLTMLEVRGED
ncbi:ABC transporter permease [Bifidobacterium sp. ESL0732]|uniref:ABC transporter permease n=1 Tax=Bifidobacterium sp. ESL0732 TaxID=2983222 RepID=UPI0023F84B6F|nr:ABC transporter permease [Bifidobacterium sp. ESL0732]WEV63818.1 ABC transporter permease [Bifidobacterium sp. ESL0732]